MANRPLPLLRSVPEARPPVLSSRKKYLEQDKRRNRTLGITNQRRFTQKIDFLAQRGALRYLMDAGKPLPVDTLRRQLTFERMFRQIRLSWPKIFLLDWHLDIHCSETFLDFINGLMNRLLQNQPLLRVQLRPSEVLIHLH
jgi:hypothetical protein